MKSWVINGLRVICDRDTEEMICKRLKPCIKLIIFCLLGKKLSAFLLEHGYAAEETVSETPTSQEISKPYVLSHPI